MARPVAMGQLYGRKLRPEGQRNAGSSLGFVTGRTLVAKHRDGPPSQRAKDTGTVLTAKLIETLQGRLGLRTLLHLPKQRCHNATLARGQRPSNSTQLHRCSRVHRSLAGLPRPRHDGQQLGHLPCASQAIAQLLRHGPIDHILELDGNARYERPQSRRILEHDLRENRKGVCPYEGSAPRKKLVEHDAQGKQVRPRTYGPFAATLLGRHVQRRSDCGALGRKGSVRGGSRDAQVENLDPHGALSVRHEKKVRGLHVPMDNAHPVQSIQTSCCLHTEVQCKIQGHTTAREPRTEVFPFEPFEHKTTSPTASLPCAMYRTMCSRSEPSPASESRAQTARPHGGLQGLPAGA